MESTTDTLLFERLPIGAYRTTPAGAQLRANAALVRLNGYQSEAEMLADVNDIGCGWYVDPARRQLFKDLMERDGQVTNFVSEVYRYKTRERIWVRETAYVVRDVRGEVLYYEGTVEDVTHVHRADEELAQSEARWRMALDAAGDGVWDWHVQTGEEYCSGQLWRMLGYDAQELPEHFHALDGLTHPDDLARMAADRDAHFKGDTPEYRNEHRLRCKDGSWKWVLSRGMVVYRDAHNRPLRMIGTLTDITPQHEARERIWRQAHLDDLTGLPNRRLLRQRLQDHLAQAQQNSTRVAVVFLDLDRFKEVNDSLGHSAGDALLAEVAHRIGQAMGLAHTLARMGGDEFTFVLGGLPARPDTEAILTPHLNAVLTALAEPYRLGSGQVFVTASMGVALYPDHAQREEDLLRYADQALYAAKAAGRNRFRVFTPVLQAEALRRARLDADLRVARDAGQLSVVYQPIVCLQTGRTFKAEALVRWQHPELGTIGPGQFIPVAEASGYIVALGDWVFEQAASQVKRWRTHVNPDFQISVNQSPVECMHQAAGQTSWAQRLLDMGLPCHCLAIEITEGLLLDTGPQVTAHLQALRDVGMDVSLDDFGTGYSSLIYLQKMHIDVIKIDQSFVVNLAPQSTELTLCKAVIAMARELGMLVVAEGVETPEQRDLLRAAGCHFGQGYLFSRPLPPGDFELWLQRSESPAPLGA